VGGCGGVCGDGVEVSVEKEWASRDLDNGEIGEIGMVLYKAVCSTWRSRVMIAAEKLEMNCQRDSRGIIHSSFSSNRGQ
jgi:hypothetical protein